MNAIPTSALADAFREHLHERRLTHLALLTFAFEPDFFEEEILSTFIDVGSSPAERIRLAILDEKLRGGVEVAVYYDPGVLDGGGRSSRLPIQRVPVRYGTGYFHPKNVLALVEDGEGRQHLIAAAMSANATRAGWWKNVEVAHLEALSEGEPSSLRDDLLGLIAAVKREVAGRGEEHVALEAIRKFLLKLTPIQVRSKDGVLHPRLYLPGQALDEFLWEAVGRNAVGLNLEVLSPFFDAADPGPLRRLIERFSPAEVRVLLPRDANGHAKCTERFFEATKGFQDCHWAHLPKEIMASGKSASATPRDVHAKVYRFFDPRRRTEYQLVGSPNLTTAAHSKGGNFETALLVDVQPPRVPDWWLLRDVQAPRTFSAAADEGSGARASPLIALSVRYHWTRESCDAFWDADQPSPPLQIEMQTATVELGSLPPQAWTPLPAESRQMIRDLLRYTSFMKISSGELEPATILVMEEGMELKPSVVLELSVAEILKYWALLAPEQRAAYLQARLETAELPPIEREALRKKFAADVASVFDTFAGIYQSFSALETKVNEALEKGQLKVVHAHLFAEKYDALPVLLDKVEVDLAKEGDAIRTYVIVLCALQLIDEVAAKLPPEDQEGRRRSKALRDRLEALRSVRDRISFEDQAGRAEFLDWFERWFFKRLVREPSAA